ncbi:MAG: GDP-mannose 4,6-dehydratase [Rhodospirillaceae bacterium]|jgi:UDP-glucose 4-epimerase|nr:GDP-mannose 4,6-dehydratase [Rhodospirillaceae bacterium]|tara:strand:+ start:536 stop:1492 length:957 start_codon:yes stop_codon:yes gene_type:complete
MKVLVTGGAGFIGANLVRRLETLSQITEVVVVDDLTLGFRKNLTGTDATLIEGSILDEGILTEAIAGASTVVHLAARSSVPRSIDEPMAAHDNNATGTALVLNAARQTDDTQVIVASSSSVYGSSEVLPKHEGLATRPISPYAASKLAAEAYALAWGHCYDIPVLALRFFNVFGPLQSSTHSYAAVIPAFLAAACQYQPLPIHGDGNQARDFTYVDSVIDVLCEAITERKSHTEPVNLAFGSQVTLLDLVTELETIFDRELPVDHKPARAGDIYRSQADSSLLMELFPRLTPTDLAAGLRATAEWFESTRPWEDQIKG